MGLCAEGGLGGISLIVNGKQLAGPVTIQFTALADRYYEQSRMFQQMRRVVRSIPKGRVATYGAVAEAAGFPGAARQVAWALRGTDGSLPWHRVLGAGGRILLPGGSGLEQRLRLESEGVRFRNGRADLAAHQHRFRTTRRSR